MSTSSYIASKQTARQRGLAFLGDHATSLTVGYAAGVSVDGTVTVQGQHGAFRHLVRVWNGIEVETDPEWPFTKWIARMGEVELHILEENPEPDPTDAELEVAWNAPDAPAAHRVAWVLHTETRS